MNTQTTKIKLTLTADIAEAIAERMRQDLEHAAEKSADYHIKASNLRVAGMKLESVEATAVYLAKAEESTRKGNRWDAEFKNLERICIALTRAGV